MSAPIWPGDTSPLFQRAVTGISRLLMLAALLLNPHSVSADHEKEPPSSDHRATLTWQFESSHVTLPRGTSDVYLRVRMQAAKSAVQARPPLNLAIVFDRSGSMKEESKIGYVRQAGHLVTDNLTRKDYVAFVAYNHQVQVLVPLHPVVNREYLHHRVDELFAEGQTNLSSGLLEGCAQLHTRLAEPGIHHVILLTDGLANRGVLDTDSLVELVTRCTERGISLSTIGVGTDYNEQLLSRLAQAGGGRYVYVSEPDKIPEAFQQELGSLLAVVAQNARLKMKLPPGIELKQVYGREEPLKPDLLEIQLGDVTSGQERVILVKLRSSSVSVTNPSIEFQMTLTYDDIAEATRFEETQSVTLERSTTKQGVVPETQPVLAYSRLVDAVDKVALAVQSMDHSVAAEVRDIQRRMYPIWKQVALDSRDQEFFNKAYMFEHYARELQDLVEHGALHEHSQARAQLQKELHYRRYLMQHHAHQH